MSPLNIRAIGLVALTAFLLSWRSVSVTLAQRVPASLEDRARTEPFAFLGAGETAHGGWRAEVSASNGRWSPGERVQIDVAVRIGANHFASLAGGGHQGRQAVRARHRRAHLRCRRLDAPAERREDVDAADAHGPGHRGRHPGRGDQPLRLPVPLAARRVPDDPGVQHGGRRRAGHEGGGPLVRGGAPGRPAARPVPPPRRPRRHGRQHSLQPQRLHVRVPPLRSRRGHLLLLTGRHRGQRHACLGPPM